MKTLFKLFALGIILSLAVSGCFLKSVHPLVSPIDSQPVNNLEGAWQDDDATWHFINDRDELRDYLGDENAIDEEDLADYGKAYFVFYETTYNGEKDTTVFTGSTIELGENYYLDLKVLDLGAGMPELVHNHFFAVHTFSRISIQQNELTIELFNDEWIHEQLLNNRVRLKHERIDGTEPEILVTASTDELQEFVKKYGSETKAYSDPISLRRIN